MDDVCTWQELVGRAGSARRARTWVSCGEWRRVLRGAYAPWSAADGEELRARALALVLPPDVALSHRAALWVLGLDVLGTAVDVTVPRGRHLQPRPGLRVHSAELDDDVVVRVHGLRAVSAARAVVDVARAEGLVEAVALGDAALRSGATTRPRMLAALEDAVGLRGVRGARAAVGLLSDRSESAMESRLRVRLLRAGLDEIEVQVDLYDHRGHVARADLLVGGVVVEFDGREAHLQGQACVHERRRQGRLLAAGAELCRSTAADVYGRSGADLAQGRSCGHERHDRAVEGTRSGASGGGRVRSAAARSCRAQLHDLRLLVVRHGAAATRRRRPAGRGEGPATPPARA